MLQRCNILSVRRNDQRVYPIRAKSRREDGLLLRRVNKRRREADLLGNGRNALSHRALEDPPEIFTAPRIPDGLHVQPATRQEGGSHVAAGARAAGKYRSLKSGAHELSCIYV